MLHLFLFFPKRRQKELHTITDLVDERGRGRRVRQTGAPKEGRRQGHSLVFGLSVISLAREREDRDAVCSRERARAENSAWGRVRSKFHPFPLPVGRCYITDDQLS